MTGPAGTGKNELVRLCVQEIIALAKKRMIHVMSVYLDCAADQTVIMMLARIFKMFYPYHVERGYGLGELIREFLDRMASTDMNIILIFDAVDFFLEHQDSKELRRFLAFLAQVMEAPLGIKRKISMIFIARRPEFVYRLEISKRLDIQRFSIHLPEYTRIELKTIIQDRINHALSDTAVPDWLASVMVDLSECLHLDLPTIFIFLANVGRKAEAENAESITAEHIREVLQHLYDWKNGIEQFYFSEQLLLFAVTKLLALHDQVFSIPISEVKHFYETLCIRHNIKHIQGKDTFANLLKMMNKKTCLLVHTTTIILCCPISVLLPRLEKLLSLTLQPIVKTP